jgi:hypothetical protein
MTGSSARASSSDTLVAHLPGSQGELLMLRPSLRYRPATNTAARATFTATFKHSGSTQHERGAWVYKFSKTTTAPCHETQDKQRHHRLPMWGQHGMGSLLAWEADDCTYSMTCQDKQHGVT